MYAIFANIQWLAFFQKLLELTDGWYSIPCQPDSALQDLIDRKKLTVGQKIVTSGAELTGSQDPCSPLEVNNVTNNFHAPHPVSYINFNFNRSLLSHTAGINQSVNFIHKKRHFIFKEQCIQQCSNDKLPKDIGLTFAFPHEHCSFDLPILPPSLPKHTLPPPAYWFVNKHLPFVPFSKQKK